MVLPESIFGVRNSVMMVICCPMFPFVLFKTLIKLDKDSTDGDEPVTIDMISQLLFIAVKVNDVIYIHAYVTI